MSIWRAAFAATVCLASLGSSACTTYQLAKDVKMVSFDDNVSTGHSVGPVRGEDCQSFVLGYPIGEPPTLDKAFADARKENGSLRYMNNVATENSGFNAVVYRQRCVVVKGAGYK
jgi:hypothetical protein